MRRRSFFRIPVIKVTVIKVIKKLKNEGRQKEIKDRLKELEKPKIPTHLAYLEGVHLRNYLHDVGIIQEYANKNRETMAKEIITRMGLSIEEEFTTCHNYIDLDNMILRKGAISAQKGERLIIPMNMRDGSIIGIGKGNPDWNYSAPKITDIMQDFQQRQVLQLQRRLFHVFLLSRYKNGF